MNSSINNQSGMVYSFNSTGELIGKVNDALFGNIFVPSFVTTILLMLLCYPGNVLVFYIYFARWRKTTSRVFILALALFDLVNGFVTTPTELAFMWNIFHWKNAPICKFSRFLTFMMNIASSFTLVGIAIDRYIRICKPLSSPMSTKTAKIWVFVSCFAAVLFAWPALVLHGFRTIKHVLPETKIVAVGSKCSVDDYFFPTKYPLIFTIVLLTGTLLIDIILITIYTLMAIQVVKSAYFNRNRHSSVRTKMQKASTSASKTDDDIIDDNNSSSETKGTSKRGTFSKMFHGPIKVNGPNQNNGKKQRSLSVQSEKARRARMMKTTTMLFLVTLLFMVSFTPYCVIAIYRYSNPKYYLSLTTTGKCVYQLFLRSYLLSMSLNPIIYCFMSIQFRKECKHGIRKLMCWKR